MRFLDRTDAGFRLAAALSGYKGQYPVVLALPRGGVPVAAEVAKALNAPLDLVLVRKIGLPGQPELAIGAVVDGERPIIVRNDELIRGAGVTDAAFEAVRKKESAEVERRRRCYVGMRGHPDLAGEVVIIVDDGIATGATMKAALQAIRRLDPKELVVAVPVAAPEAIEELRDLADTIICLETPTPFGAIGYFYDDFSQVSDAEVVSTLERFPFEQRAAR